MFCSSTEGDLIQNYSGGGYLLLEDSRAKINEAFRDCCDGMESTCKLFYEVDGSNDCAGYNSPQYRMSFYLMTKVISNTNQMHSIHNMNGYFFSVGLIITKL